MSVFALKKTDIERAREAEAIAQFAMQGAIGNLDYSGPYDIYLYSEAQAGRLREHLGKIGFKKVECIPLDDVGMMEVEREHVRPGRTPEQIEEQAKQRRASEAQRRKDKRAKDAIAAGREPGANSGRGGRPAGAKDRIPRKPKASG